MSNNKRPLESPESDHSNFKMSKPETNDAIIGEFFNKPNPSNQDLMSVLHQIWGKVSNTDNTVAAIDNRVKKVENTVDSNVQSIANINKEISLLKVNNDCKFIQLQNQINENSTNVNGILQNELEKDIVIYGFKDKPALDKVVTNFMRLSNVSIDFVKHCFVQTDPIYGKSRIIVSFKTKQAKILVMQHIISNGPPYYSQLDPDISDDINFKLQIANNLSKFNRSVRASLLGLKRSKVIFKLRFRQRFFQVKEKEDSEWKTIDNNIALLNIMKLKDQLPPQTS